MPRSWEEWRRLQEEYPEAFEPDRDHFAWWVMRVKDPMLLPCPICEAQPGMRCERHGTILMHPHDERAEQPKENRFSWWRNGRKFKRRKLKYLPGYTSTHQSNRERLNRRERHEQKQLLKGMINDLQESQ